MTLPAQTVRVRGLRSVPDHDLVLEESREVVCPACGAVFERYLTPHELTGRPWPEAVAHWDALALAELHACAA